MHPLRPSILSMSNKISENQEWNCLSLNQLNHQHLNNMEPSLPQTLRAWVVVVDKTKPRAAMQCCQNLLTRSNVARVATFDSLTLKWPLGISTRSCAATQSCRFSRSTRSLRCFGKHFHFGLEKSPSGKRVLISFDLLLLQSSDLYVTLPRTEHNTLSLGQLLHGFIVSRPDFFLNVQTWMDENRDPLHQMFGRRTQ